MGECTERCSTICYDVVRHGNDPRLHFSVAEYSAALVAGTDIKASTVRTHFTTIGCQQST
ncbi:hypothetical protein PCI56_13100 [Plesiomonas shigelloides subsp. oncorhynchi]|nr:hypothetical protein [Plesiomonas shigelloides]